MFRLISKKQRIGCKTEGLPSFANFKQTSESSEEMKPFYAFVYFLLVCLFYQHFSKEETMVMKTTFLNPFLS